MSDTAKPLSAIVAEARKSLADDSWIDEITALDEDGEPDDFARRVVLLEDALEAIDRIEAAAERERRKYERLHECFWIDGAIQSIVRQLLDERDDLREQNPKASEVAAHFAQLLKKAATRAPGNAAALREALQQCGRALEKAQCSSAFQAANTESSYVAAALSSAHAALAAPARNCDVGTAEEQAERHGRYCAAHYKADCVDAQCFGCPASDKKETDCEFVWGQLPFAPAKEPAK